MCPELCSSARRLKNDDRITVLLVDDHEIVRRGFRRMLEDEPYVLVVGEASNGIEAFAQVQRYRPRVVVMDSSMPEMSGIRATRHIVVRFPTTAVLMLSMHSEQAWVRQAMEAGARGYILKSANGLDLASAIAKVAAGELVIDPLLEGVVSKQNSAVSLSAREIQVLRLIVNGKSNKEIAAALCLSENTINVHRTNIMRELKVHRTAQLVFCAIRERLVNLS